MIQEFALSITAIGDNQYLVRTETVAKGVQLAEEKVQWPVADWLKQAQSLTYDDPILDLLKEPQNPTTATSSDDNLTILTKLGRVLHNGLFTGQLHDSWITAQGVAQNRQDLLRLRIGFKDIRLQHLPWEALRAGTQLLATGTDVIFSRYILNRWQERSIPQDKADGAAQALRILMVIASPDNQERLELNQEAHHLQSELHPEAVEPSDTLIDVHLTILEQPGRAELTQELARGSYQVLHYAGHSNLGNASGDLYLVSRKTGLTERLGGEDLAGLLVNNGIKLAVFNSCRGGYSSSSEQGWQERNLAEALVSRGMPAVIAMTGRIPDHVAITFTQLLYRNFRKGQSIDLSLNRTRQGLISAYGSHQFYWTMPVLYMHPSFDGYLVKTESDVLAERRISSLFQIDNLLRENPISLDLSGWGLIQLPSEIFQAENLEYLNLSKNKLISIPNEIGKLTSLKKLVLSKNQLAQLPKELGELIELREIYLDHNQFRQLPRELSKLTKLREIYLGHNHLKHLPRELRQLTQVEKIDLSHNNLATLPKFLMHLSCLEALFLHENKKLAVSAEILGPTCEQVIEGYIPAKPKDIINYFSQIRSEQQPLNEAKLILVGFGNVGKTSIVNRLINNEFDPMSEKTEGIQITQWPVSFRDEEDINLNVWDFGGQEIMHSTHQFFLTERSLYILVLNGRQGHEDTDAEYWLELINSFGEKSPVIVVLNKINSQPFDVNRGDLQQKFPFIREFIKTDCSEPLAGINSLRAAIYRETDRLEHLRDPFPASWLGIKQQLTDLKDNYISFEKYRGICQMHNELNPVSQDSLAVYLHNLGIALNYTNDPRLRDTHILNPHWITKGIYTVLNAPEVVDAKGELEIACLARILEPLDYPPERHGFLLELMKKFELGFFFGDDENRYLIPDLLDKQQPFEASESFDASKCLNFQYNYPILPKGVLPRFIVRTHVLSTQRLRWRTGVILTFESNRALVKANYKERCVTINVDGDFESRRRLLAIIRSDFERIHSSFQFKPEEMVPIPRYSTVTVSYRELLARERQKRKSFDVFLGGDELLEINVEQMLNGIDIEGSRNSRSRADENYSALRLFYSYSHEDELFREQLDTHLKILERQGLISPWHDRCINGGEDWTKEIDSNLKNADIVLLLISADFIASDYCYENELSTAMERHTRGEAQVVPIIVRPTDWQGTPFVSLQVLPTNMKAVTQWTDRDAAWLHVEAGIKDVIELIKANSNLLID